MMNMITNNTALAQWLTVINTVTNLTRVLLVGVFLLVNLIPTVWALETPQEWLLVKNKQHLDIFVHGNESGYFSVKAQTIVIGQPTDLINILDNVENACNWISNCQAVEILEKPNDLSRVVRTRFNAPWPFKDREMVTYSTFDWAKNGDLTIQIINYASHIMTSSDYITMQKVHGSWTITQQKKGKMLIQYQGYGEPVGKLPIWLANKITIQSTFETFIALEQQFKNSQ